MAPFAVKLTDPQMRFEAVLPKASGFVFAEYRKYLTEQLEKFGNARKKRGAENILKGRMEFEQRMNLDKRKKSEEEKKTEKILDGLLAAQEAEVQREIEPLIGNGDDTLRGSDGELNPWEKRANNYREVPDSEIYGAEDAHMADDE